MSEHNREVYEDERTARHYGDMVGLSSAESAALALVADGCRGARILDLGVGGGRTTSHLLAVSSDYTGVDYAEAMVQKCREKYPGTRFELADARQLKQFGDGAFDLILFSFNGIDYAPHSDRVRILNAVHRVLCNNGIFIFSSHNAAFDRKVLYSPLMRVLAQLHDFIRVFIPDGRRFHDDEGVAYQYRVEKLWSIGLQLRTYYIAAEDQIRQLDRMGFRCASVIGKDGNRVGEAGDTVSPWIYYVARKSS